MRWTGSGQRLILIFQISPADIPELKTALVESLFMPVRDAAFGEVVRREFEVDAITHKDADAVAAHAA